MKTLIQTAIETLSDLTCVHWMEKSENVSKLVGHDHYVLIQDEGR